MVLLQVVAGNGEALSSTVNQLTESSISLAEAAANFGALKVMFGVFLVFVLIMLLFFLYQMLSYNKKISDIHDSTKKLEKFLERTSNRSIGSVETNILLRRVFSSLAQTVKYTILRYRIENHLDQRESVSTKVHRFVNYEYAELRSFLSNFECDDRDLGSIVLEEDVNIVIEFMLEQIYLEKNIFSVASMDQSTDILLNGIKLKTLKKIS